MLVFIPLNTALKEAFWRIFFGKILHTLIAPLDLPEALKLSKISQGKKSCLNLFHVELLASEMNDQDRDIGRGDAGDPRCLSERPWFYPAEFFPGFK